jgi:hypothetical protein
MVLSYSAECTRRRRGCKAELGDHTGLLVRRHRPQALLDPDVTATKGEKRDVALADDRCCEEAIMS